MINRQHLEEILKNNFGKEVKKIEGNWFLINENVVRVCYSKDLGHSDYKRYFFGVQKDKYQKYHANGVQILYICGAFTQSFLIPSAVLDNLLKGVSVANDNNWKFDIHQMNNKFELIVTGKSHIDISSYRIQLNPSINS